MERGETTHERWILREHNTLNIFVSSFNDYGRLVSGSSGNSVVVRNIRARALVDMTFTAHPIYFCSILISIDGACVVVGNGDTGCETRSRTQ